METKVAVPIAGRNPDQAQEQVKAAQAAGADLLELRVDYLEGLSVELVRTLVAEIKNAGGKPLPLIVTCRDKQQGGALDYPARLRVDVLAAALRAGAEFIDIEYDNFRTVESQERIRLALSQSRKGRLILSAHNFEGKFDNIGKLFRTIANACPGAIPKLIYVANHINDCLDALDLLHQTSAERIVFCMGEAGLISRILVKKLGGFVTFASVDEQNATAPGQLTIRQLKTLYRHDAIQADTHLFGVIADPVGHSLSPAIHNVCFGEKGLNCLYLPLLVEGGQWGFDSFVNQALLRKWLNFGGFSVTIPHKENALDYVRARRGVVEPLAAKIGAANTLLVGPDGKLIASNTDYAGALDAITAGMKLGKTKFSGLPVAIVGAGGVARALVAGLSDAGATITIYNRTLERAEKLAAEFGCAFAPLDEVRNVDAKLLINCTSIGMHPNVEAMPIPAEILKKTMAVFDTVYNPAETLLLKEAKKLKAKTIDGVAMFVNQAMAQFRLFTNQDANADLMRQTVVESLDKT
ncbi:MAG TPA: shikimate dehydrogenase [Sedimentisphaerales bacterium]|nr:shikimate dehydrogenase [Sedimentisphaerales bacterium]